MLESSCAAIDPNCGIIAFELLPLPNPHEQGCLACELVPDNYYFETLVVCPLE